MINIIIIRIAFLFPLQHSQTDTSRKIILDSIKNLELLQSTEILKQYDSVKIADSLYKEGLLKEIESLKNTGGVKIMTPHYQALRDGNSTTIPENYLSKDYQAPSFRDNDGCKI